MVDLDTEICVCNSITLNDGLNIPLVLSMVKQKKI